jgi:hypothetical protein
LQPQVTFWAIQKFPNNQSHRRSPCCAGDGVASGFDYVGECRRVRGIRKSGSQDFSKTFLLLLKS